MRQLRSSKDRLKHALVEYLKKFCTWFVWIWHRVIAEPGYIDAVAALAVAIAELFCRNRQVKRVVRETANTIVVMIRALALGEGSDRRLGPDGEYGDQRFWA